MAPILAPATDMTSWAPSGGRLTPYAARVRQSEFWQVMEAAFGAARARALADDLVLAALGGRTPTEALGSGVPVRTVWDAVCEAMELDDDARWRHRDDARRRR
jgi:hypothetical protein